MPYLYQSPDAHLSLLLHYLEKKLRAMSALVNYTVDDDFRSTGSRLDVYYPPAKRIRFNSSFALDEVSVSSIEILPDECLMEIFIRLPLGKSISSSACVSKHWLMLLSSIRSAEFCGNKYENVEYGSDGYLTRCLEGKNATDVRLSAIAVGTASRGGLGKLMIKGSTNLTNGVSDIGLSAISHYCHSLRVLSLWNSPLVGDQGLFAIAKECPFLENIVLSHCTMISNNGLTVIAENCSNLISLSIESCPKINDQGIASLVSSVSSSLTKLKIHALRITDFSLAVISHYGKSLTTLILTGLQNVSQKGFWVMGTEGGLKKLTSLTISSCPGITDMSLEAIGKGCSNLKQMSLKKCCFVSDSGLVGFAKLAGSLESLLLDECNRITQSGILCVLSKLKSLSIVKCMGIKELPLNINVSYSTIRSLCIRNCSGFGIGKLCHRLKNIDFSGLHGITDDDLLAILEGCKNGGGLVKVNLSGCLNLTDRVISAMADLHGGTLKLLSLEDCLSITDVSVVAIGDKCMTLNDLDLSKCSVSDLGIAFLSCRGNTNLQILSLSGCSNVSDECMPFLEKLGNSLEGLNLKNCSSISRRCVDQLVDSLWSCDILASM